QFCPPSAATPWPTTRPSPSAVTAQPDARSAEPSEPERPTADRERPGSRRLRRGARLARRRWCAERLVVKLQPDTSRPESAVQAPRLMRILFLHHFPERESLA